MEDQKISGDSTLNILKKWNKWIWPIVVLFFASFFVLCSSPIFKPDTFDDVNAMLTIGRSMLHGAVPLKTLVDQRGPIIYFLYAFAALISSNSFLGVWVIELINAVFVYFISVHLAKDLNLKWAYWLGLVGPIVLMGTSPIYGGGSPEEFAFTSVLYLIEVIVRAKGDLGNVSMTSYFWVALNMGLVFWSKYSLIGAFIVFFIWAGCNCIDKRNFKRLGRIVLYSLAGFLLVTAVVLIYYLFTNGIGDLFNRYFIQNITMYNVGPNNSFLAVLLGKIILFGQALLLHPVFILLLVIGAIAAIYQGEPLSVIMVTLLGDMALVAYSGDAGQLINFPCPFLIMMPYLVIALLVIIQVVSKAREIRGSKAKYGIVFNFFLVMCLLVLPFINNLYLNSTNPILKASTMTKSSKTSIDGNRYHAQPNFGDRMKQISKKPTLLMMNTLDEGFYLTSGAVPTTTYWQQLNMPSNPEMFDSFYNTLKHKKVQFVVVAFKGVFTRKPKVIKKIMARQMLNHDVAINRGPVRPDIKKKIIRNSDTLMKNYKVLDADGNNALGGSAQAIIPYYVLLERK